MLRYVNPQSGTVTLYGLIGSFISNVTNAMGITYETAFPADGEYGAVDADPEKFTGMLRSVCVYGLNLRVRTRDFPIPLP